MSNERYMRAYFFTFTPTGNDAVDAILEAIAMAGKAYHSTAQWDEAEQYGDMGYWTLIQQRANEAAAALPPPPSRHQAWLAPAEPLYQIKEAFPEDPRDTWRDASAKAYDLHTPSKRRVLYAALPPPVKD